MKASELRIGNYIYGKGIETVKSIEVEGYIWFDKERNLSIELCKTIPLTEEWLLKFGFSKQDYKMSGCYIYKLGTIIIMNSFLDNGRKDMGITVEGISPPTWSLADLYFVHQLQNLCFALTGEELTLKQ